MYYTSKNKADLENYNSFVTLNEGYSSSTKSWSEVIKHYREDLYAILVNEKYDVELDILEQLNGWYDEENTI